MTDVDSTRSVPPAGLGPGQILGYTSLAAWQFEAGVAAGLIPAADLEGPRWSMPAALAIAAAATRSSLWWAQKS